MQKFPTDASFRPGLVSDFQYRRTVVFLTRGANKTRWTIFKELRLLVASMKTVSGEDHQHGSLAETKITGCHDSTLLQWKHNTEIIRLKKPSQAPPAAANRSGGSRPGSGKCLRCWHSCFLFPPPRLSRGLFQCEGGGGAPLNQLQLQHGMLTKQIINSSLSGGKRFFPNLCPLT